MMSYIMYDSFIHIYVSFCVGLGFVEARTSFPTFEFCYSQSRLDSWYIDLWALQFSWK